MERINKFTPAFDKRNPDPKKDYGIGSVKLAFILKGELGAVDFIVHTGWYTPEIEAHHLNKDGLVPDLLNNFRTIFMPHAADIGYHSPVPRHDGQKPVGSSRMETLPEGEKNEFITGNKVIDSIRFVDTGTFTPCEYLDGRPCYSDGSPLQADKYFEILRREGSDGLWLALEKYYVDTFGELK